LAGCATSAPPAAMTPIDAREVSADPGIAVRPPTALAVVTWSGIAALPWPEPQSRNRGYGNAAKADAATVYADGGTEIYCRIALTGEDIDAKKVDDLKLQWEHAFPASLIARGLRYADRDCREPLSNAQETCPYAIADLQNLWPSIGRINGSRGNLPYGELEGEGTTNETFAEFCPDYERGKVGGLVYVEPTQPSQGDLARSLIYMHMVYDIELDSVIDDPDRLLVWHRRDPPDAEEKSRERAIRTLQGSWNPLILPAPGE
jgi:endonuclease I